MSDYPSDIGKPFNVFSPDEKIREAQEALASNLKEAGVTDEQAVHEALQNLEQAYNAGHADRPLKSPGDVGREIYQNLTGNSSETSEE